MTTFGLLESIAEAVFGLDDSAWRTTLGLEESSSGISEPEDNSIGSMSGLATSRAGTRIGDEGFPFVARFGLELLAATKLDSIGEDEARSRLEKEATSSRDGSLARSSTEGLLNNSQGGRPRKPSLDPTLPMPEPAVDGRRSGDPTSEVAVDGLDRSACASYRSRSVFTDRLRVIVGKGLVGLLESPALSDPRLLAFVFAIAKRVVGPVPGNIFSSFEPSRLSRRVLGNKICAGLVGYGVWDVVVARKSSESSRTKRNAGRFVCD